MRLYRSNIIGAFINPPALFLGFLLLCAPSTIRAQAAQASGSAATPTTPVQPKPSVELPEGDGKAIATEYCQDCHKLENVVKARKTPDDWHDTVQTMMDRGARVPQDKVDILIRYLAKNFAPETAAPAANSKPSSGSPSDAPATAPAAAAAQAPKPVELPEGEGKAIATEFCQDCHKLSNVTKAHKNSDDWHDTVQTMMDRGARLPQDKVDTLVAYLVKNFGPKDDAAPSGSGSAATAPAPAATPSH